MAVNGHGVDMTALARQGAQARMVEIETEIAALRKAFPELQILASVNGSHAVTTVEPAATPKRRRTLNAAQRAVISKRMKKYWRQRRAERAGL